MKNKLIALLTMSALAVGTLAGCGNTAATDTAASAADTAAEPTVEAVSTVADEAADTNADKYADLSGSVSMSGSTSMEKLANAVAESFMEKYPNVTVTAEFTGSSAGIESVLAGSVDIGNSSRNLKDDEKSAGAVENIVAIDGIAVVADPANKVEDLTRISWFPSTPVKQRTGVRLAETIRRSLLLVVRQAPVQEVRLKSCWTSQMPAFTQTNWIPPVPLWQRLLPPPVRSVMFLSML